MKNEADELLDDILSRWHHWAKHQSVTRGHARTSAGMDQYRTSRQYDDTNGALDSDLENRRCRQVNFDVEQMLQPHQTVIYMLARNLSTGRSVWGSPRLPADPRERDVLIVEARNIIAKKLLASGVL